MKLVAVSQRVESINSRAETIDSLDQRVITFAQAVGIIPLPIPNNLGTKITKAEDPSTLELFLKKTLPTGFILTGGNDLGENIERDNTEFALLNYAEKYRLPVLGICRGMQVMASRAGALLVRRSGHTNTRHRLKGLSNNEVNSYHNYSIKDCPKGFTIMAKSQSNSIEAIHHNSLPWEGWMWHPEREITFTEYDIKRAKQLLSS